MKKIGLVFKETSEGKIKDSLKNTSAIFVIKYSGLSSPDITTLRQNLRKSRAKLMVVKNSVAQRAFAGSELQSLVKAIEGPCGLVFAQEEAVEASKILCDFTKGHEQLKLTAGFLENRILEENDIKFLAKLPSKDILRAQVVGALNAPIAGLVITLNQILAKFVYCLEEIKKKKTN